ncbi:MAG: hypothetical protein ACI3YI_10020 [Bacteroidaceae bacterium]
MANLRMRIGNNLGNILLEIAQENIVNGEPEKAFDTYINSLNGFTKEYALQVLKNEGVLVVDEENQTLNLETSKDIIKANKKNIYNWKAIINEKYDFLGEILQSIYNIRNEFSKHYNKNINDVNITEIVEKHFGKDNMLDVGINNLAAKLIGGDSFATELYSNGQKVWEILCADVENNDANRYQHGLYCIVKYVDLIRALHKEFLKFEKTYRWLLENGFISRIYFIDNRVENILELLCKFANPNVGYYHPMCDEKLYVYKDELMNDLHKSTWGNEYVKFGILKKEITDGYDAGWLSPEGDFYGQVGETEDMMHLNIAEQLFDKKYNEEMSKDGVSAFSSNSPEKWLDVNGWIKIHHDEIYGTFIGNKIPTDDFKYKYCPTKIQIDKICEYLDKNWKGKFYSKPKIVRITAPIFTYQLKQMDDVKLHEIFSI